MVPCIADNQYKYKIGLTEDDLCYNGGVIFFDVQMWKQVHCEEILLQFMLTEGAKRNFFAADNEVILLALKGRIAPMALKYNLNTVYLLYTTAQLYELYQCREAHVFSDAVIQQTCAQPVIIHYVGLQVGYPWEKGNVHPLRALWETYKNASLWSECAQARVKMPLAIRAQRHLYHLLPRKMYIRVHCIMAQKLFFSKYGNDKNRSDESTVCNRHGVGSE